jgi:18S rRNA (guanine1575-N7)-methyltransferase
LHRGAGTPPDQKPLRAARAQARHALVLDIGCGSGLSGGVLTQRGAAWVGVDVAGDMLRLAAGGADCAGRLALGDVGQGLPSRGEIFDAAISISAVQWLCVAPDPAAAVRRLFGALWRALRSGGCAALQVYTEGAPAASCPL